jgi:hypothetical protein
MVVEKLLRTLVKISRCGDKQPSDSSFRDSRLVTARQLGSREPDDQVETREFEAAPGNAISFRSSVTFRMIAKKPSRIDRRSDLLRERS